MVLVLGRCQETAGVRETGPASGGAGLGSRGEEGAEGCLVYPGVNGGGEGVGAIPWWLGRAGRTGRCQISRRA